MSLLTMTLVQYCSAAWLRFWLRRPPGGQNAQHLSPGALTCIFKLSRAATPAPRLCPAHQHERLSTVRGLRRGAGACCSALAYQQLTAACTGCSHGYGLRYKFIHNHVSIYNDSDFDTQLVSILRCVSTACTHACRKQSPAVRATWERQVAKQVVQSSSMQCSAVQIFWGVQAPVMTSCQPSLYSPLRMMPATNLFCWPSLRASCCRPMSSCPSWSRLNPHCCPSTKQLWSVPCSDRSL